MNSAELRGAQSDRLVPSNTVRRTVPLYVANQEISDKNTEEGQKRLDPHLEETALYRLDPAKASLGLSFSV